MCHPPAGRSQRPAGPPARAQVQRDDVARFLRELRAVVNAAARRP